jgi:hypothetical protein
MMAETAVVENKELGFTREHMGDYTIEKSEGATGANYVVWSNNIPDEVRIALEVLTEDVASALCKKESDIDEINEIIKNSDNLVFISAATREVTTKRTTFSMEVGEYLDFLPGALAQLIVGDVGAFVSKVKTKIGDAKVMVETKQKWYDSIWKHENIEDKTQVALRINDVDTKPGSFTVSFTIVAFRCSSLVWQLAGIADGSDLSSTLSAKNVHLRVVKKSAKQNSLDLFM